MLIKSKVKDKLKLMKTQFISPLKINVLSAARKTSSTAREMSFGDPGYSGILPFMTQRRLHRRKRELGPRPPPKSVFLKNNILLKTKLQKKTYYDVDIFQKNQ